MAEAPGEGEEAGREAPRVDAGPPPVSNRPPAPVLALVDDLFVRSRIDAAASVAGVEVRYVQSGNAVCTLRLAVTPMHDILNQLQRFFPGLIHEEVRVYFRDVFDHAVRMSEATSTLGEMISAALQVNLAMVSVGQNEVTKRLAGWAAILAIPTTVGAIYGMNFENMPELRWAYGYYAAVGTTVAMCLALYLRLKRAGWL